MSSVSIAIAEMSGLSVVTAQVVALLQQLVVFQTPPPTLAAYATIEPFVVVVGSATMSLMRPSVRP